MTSAGGDGNLTQFEALWQIYLAGVFLPCTPSTAACHQCRGGAAVVIAACDKNLWSLKGFLCEKKHPHFEDSPGGVSLWGLNSPRGCVTVLLHVPHLTLRELDNQGGLFRTMISFRKQRNHKCFSTASLQDSKQLIDTISNTQHHGGKQPVNSAISQRIENFEWEEEGISPGSSPMAGDLAPPASDLAHLGSPGASMCCSSEFAAGCCEEASLAQPSNSSASPALTLPQLDGILLPSSGSGAGEVADKGAGAWWNVMPASHSPSVGGFRAWLAAGGVGFKGTARLLGGCFACCCFQACTHHEDGSWFRGLTWSCFQIALQPSRSSMEGRSGTCASSFDQLLPPPNIASPPSPKVRYQALCFRL